MPTNRDSPLANEEVRRSSATSVGRATNSLRASMALAMLREYRMPASGRARLPIRVVTVPASSPPWTIERSTEPVNTTSSWSSRLKPNLRVESWLALMITTSIMTMRGSGVSEQGDGKAGSGVVNCVMLMPAMPRTVAESDESEPSTSKVRPAGAVSQVSQRAETVLPAAPSPGASPAVGAACSAGTFPDATRAAACCRTSCHLSSPRAMFFSSAGLLGRTAAARLNSVRAPATSPAAHFGLALPGRDLERLFRPADLAPEENDTRSSGLRQWPTEG
jgi:hypothetical protein